MESMKAAFGEMYGRLICSVSFKSRLLLEIALNTWLMVFFQKIYRCAYCIFTAKLYLNGGFRA